MKTLIITAALLFNCCLFSQAQINTVLDSIPFSLEADNRMYTWCKVNQSDSLLFLIDTGASGMVINSNRLDKVNMVFDKKVTNLGTTGTTEIPSSSSNSFTWGGQNHKNISFVSIPYQNERWDGVLGLSILTRYVVEINYDKKLIYLYDKNTYKNKSSNKIKMEFRHQVPFVALEIKTKGKVFRPLLEVDTGSDRVIDLSTPFVKKHRLSTHFDLPYAISTITSSDGNSGRINNVYFDQVNIAKFSLYRVAGGWSEVQFGMLNSPECDGMIGNNFLKRFNLVFDFESNYLYWSPNNYIYTPFYTFLVN